MLAQAPHGHGHGRAAAFGALELIKDIAAPGPSCARAKIDPVVCGPGGCGIPADLEVTGDDPLRRYAFSVTAGPGAPGWRASLHPFNGASEVIFTATPAAARRRLTSAERVGACPLTLSPMS
ncbi:hypothetical protein GCM10009657_04060 [Oryzihumus leptocrescens]